MLLRIDIFLDAGIGRISYYLLLHLTMPALIFDAVFIMKIGYYGNILSILLCFPKFKLPMDTNLTILIFVEYFKII
jgi:hypothetical protein